MVIEILTIVDFIANEQEDHRNPLIGGGDGGGAVGNEPTGWFPAVGNPNNFTVEALSSNVDDKTMHEMYLWPFADAVHAGAGSMMCAYQRINNSYACHNSKAQNGLLKTELGFEGFIVTDWRALRKSCSVLYQEWIFPNLCRCRRCSSRRWLRHGHAQWLDILGSWWTESCQDGTKWERGRVANY